MWEWGEGQRRWKLAQKGVNGDEKNNTTIKIKAYLKSRKEGKISNLTLYLKELVKEQHTTSTE